MSSIGIWSLGLISLVWGILNCFWGYKIFRAILGITGFFAAGGLAGGVVFVITKGNIVFAVLAGLVAGGIGAVLLTTLWVLGVFLLGTVTGLLTGIVILQWLHTTQQGVVLLVLALLGGVLAVVFKRFMIVFTTAMSGAWTIVLQLHGLIFQGRHPLAELGKFQQGSATAILPQDAPKELLAILLLWLVFTAAGMAVQYSLTAPEIKAGQKPPGL